MDEFLLVSGLLLSKLATGNDGPIFDARCRLTSILKVLHLLSLQTLISHKEVFKAIFGLALFKFSKSKGVSSNYI